MDWFGETIGELNFVPLLVAAIVGMFVGMVWYHPAFFGTTWRKAAKLSKKQVESKKGMTEMFLGSFIAILFSATVLDVLIQNTPVRTIVDGMLFGAVLGLFFSGTALLTTNLYQRKSINLTAIDAGYNIVVLAVAGAILVSLS